MSRAIDPKRFETVFAERIVGGRFQEDPAYYPRYRPRYEAVLRRFAADAPAEPLDVLDVGGGQLAVLAHHLWGDRPAVADIGGPHLDGLRQQGVRTVVWNLIADQQPVESAFDTVFFSEVIEHLPVPGHLPLERLRRALRPGGRIYCTTPNLFRPRNLVYLALGRSPFDYFRYPTDTGCGHILEYTRDHLLWQFERAGFRDCRIEAVHLPDAPFNPAARVLAWLGSPLYLIPRFRDVLFASAVAP